MEFRQLRIVGERVQRPSNTKHDTENNPGR